MNKKSYRVLHVLGGLGMGGIETWLVNVFRHVSKKKIYFDFFIDYTKEDQHYMSEIRNLGGVIHFGSRKQSLWQYLMQLRKVIKEHDAYTVVHIHGRKLVGIQSLVAKLSGAKIVIGHTHNLDILSKKTLKHRLIYQINKTLKQLFCDYYLGCSVEACDSVFGRDSTKKYKKVYFFPYGINFKPYRNINKRKEVFKELSLDNRKKIIGHIGSFRHEKNHKFLIRMIKEMVVKDPLIHLLLVGGGEGPIKDEVLQMIEKYELKNHISLLGLRSDIPRLFSAFDTFVFPSTSEGFGIVAIEAQSAGVPCVVSTKVPASTTIIPLLIKRLSLDSDISIWVDSVLQSIDLGYNKDDAWNRVNNSMFSIEVSCKNLLSDYYKLDTH
jgi:glycosyltransferase involved in cell wall biosynthesis